MKANEFVKNKGIKTAKLIIDCWRDYPETDVYLPEMMEYTFIAIKPTDTCPYVSLDDLKRLIRSHSLVADLYGPERARKYAESDYTAPEVKAALKQAIADVESCKEVV
ncbi:hypothetical protein [Acinetobacter sp. ANC 5414]|uniref:hypothetical protein n=1 Tax=Acinetobacter sp. ANC 5414 TaxID=2731251 RepID=UPI0014905861|nr:hypothetical protein [Acinetobacter sp. ANC 5414]NNH01643.1 hypothetical protein [Acinetobacter sp. ANC 5414]